MQKDALVLPSPAKLNLMLHILGRREDGYHQLETVFQFLDYGDEMTFAVRDDGKICLNTPFEGVPHDQNLIVKAAKKLQEQSSCSLGIDIWIKKVLPMGGGIGDEFKGQFQFFFEFIVRFHVVARHTENNGPGFFKFLEFVAKLHGLGGAARSVVLGVEVQNKGLTIVGGIGHLHAPGCVCFKFGKGFINNNRHAPISQV